MKKPVEIGRVLLFTELLFNTSRIDNDSINRVLSDYRMHHGFDYIVYVEDPSCEIVVLSTGDSVPMFEIPQGMQIGFPTSIRFFDEEPGSEVRLQYCADRLRDTVLQLGRVDEVPRSLKLERIELAVVHFSDVRADLDESFDS